MPVAEPSPRTTNPLRRIRDDLRIEHRAVRRIALPPGPKSWSPARDFRVRRQMLDVLLEAHERYGPVFTLRTFHLAGVWMLGPEANRFMLVSDRDKFVWRDGLMGDLIPLIGDGLLTTDGEFHDVARRIMMPAFHREHVLKATEVMVEEADRALDRWRPGARADLYDWTRHVAMRIAMRSLFGLDPDATGGVDVAREFERGLSFHGEEFVLQVLRGPGAPFERVKSARRVLDRILGEEIARRRHGDEGNDVLTMLLHATDESGVRLSDEQVRDQALTLLFAGHDTTTSTVAFLFYELARSPEWRQRLVAEQEAVCGSSPPSGEQLFSELPLLDQVVDETLRLYPPAWIGPRRAAVDFEFAGRRIPAGVPVNYSSWASHRLADVFEDPHAFRPERFAPEERAKLPTGAYVPFGAGPRICIGMRFGQLEVKAIASRILSRFRLELEPGWELKIRQMPTLSPRGGLPVRVERRS
ncbi:MAG: cytochrome P450 [Solirubrobacterales bacterium]